MSLAGRKVVELFYDCVSPYSWIAFEVCSKMIIMTECYSGRGVLLELQIIYGNMISFYYSMLS